MELTKNLCDVEVIRHPSLPPDVMTPLDQLFVTDCVTIRPKLLKCEIDDVDCGFCDGEWHLRRAFNKISKVWIWKVYTRCAIAIAEQEIKDLVVKSYH